MAKEVLALALLLSFLELNLVATDALAERRYPPGTEDNGTSICAPKK